MAETTTEVKGTNVSESNGKATDAESVADKAAAEAAEKKRLADIENRAIGRLGLLRDKIRREEVGRTPAMLAQARYVREYVCIRVAAVGAIPTKEEISEEADRLQLTGEIVDQRAKAHASACRDVKNLYAEERPGERCNPSDMLRSLAFVELYQEHLARSDKDKADERNPEKIGVSHLRQLARLVEWDGVEGITAPTDKDDKTAYVYPCRWKEETKTGALRTVIPQCFPRTVREKELAPLSVAKLTEAIDQLGRDAEEEGKEPTGKGAKGAEESEGSDGPTEPVNTAPTMNKAAVVKAMQKVLFNPRKPAPAAAKNKAFRELAETNVLTAAQICAAIEGMTESYLAPRGAKGKKDEGRPTLKDVESVLKTARACYDRIKREASAAA